LGDVACKVEGGVVCEIAAGDATVDVTAGTTLGVIC
jgi:hypothetical protein